MTKRKFRLQNVSVSAVHRAEELLLEPGCPFSCVEECIADMLKYRLRLLASGNFDEVKELDEKYHLNEIRMFAESDRGWGR